MRAFPPGRGNLRAPKGGWNFSLFFPPGKRVIKPLSPFRGFIVGIFGEKVKGPWGEEWEKTQTQLPNLFWAPVKRPPFGGAGRGPWKKVSNPVGGKGGNLVPRWGGMKKVYLNKVGYPNFSARVPFFWGLKGKGPDARGPKWPGDWGLRTKRGAVWFWVGNPSG